MLKFVEKLGREILKNNVKNDPLKSIKFGVKNDAKNWVKIYPPKCHL
jgi:hypothetical protein